MSERARTTKRRTTLTLTIPAGIALPAAFFIDNSGLPALGAEIADFEGHWFVGGGQPQTDFRIMSISVIGPQNQLFFAAR